MIDGIPGLNTTNIKIITTKVGIPDKISIKRCKIVSTRPPSKPEIKPTTTPMEISSIAAIKAMNSEIRVPINKRLNKSRPRLSVPKIKYTSLGTPASLYLSTNSPPTMAFPLRPLISIPGIFGGKLI